MNSSAEESQNAEYILNIAVSAVSLDGNVMSNEVLQGVHNLDSRDIHCIHANAIAQVLRILGPTFHPMRLPVSALAQKKWLVSIARDARIEPHVLAEKVAKWITARAAEQVYEILINIADDTIIGARQSETISRIQDVLLKHMKA